MRVRPRRKSCLLYSPLMGGGCNEHTHVRRGGQIKPNSGRGRRSKSHYAVPGARAALRLGRRTRLGNGPALTLPTGRPIMPCTGPRMRLPGEAGLAAAHAGGGLPMVTLSRGANVMIRHGRSRGRSRLDILYALAAEKGWRAGRHCGGDPARGRKASRLFPGLTRAQLGARWRAKHAYALV